MSTTFPLLGEPLALDLANTVVAGGRDLLRTEGELAAWLDAEEGRLPARAAPTAELLEALRSLRADLAQLFGAALAGERLPKAAADRVNEASALAPSYLRLDVGGDEPAARPVSAPSSPARVVQAAIAASAIELLGGADRERVRRCECEACVLVFVATNPRRRWCSPSACGNRVRVARHYARQRANA
jgi:predicted RNA-binding Zn ribbon-like protein